MPGGLVNGDGHRSPAPGIGIAAGQPDIDPVADDRTAGIGGDGIAIAGDVHSAAQAYDAGIDGDDAVAYRHAAGGRAAQAIRRGFHGVGGAATRRRR